MNDESISMILVLFGVIVCMTVFIVVPQKRKETVVKENVTGEH